MLSPTDTRLPAARHTIAYGYKSVEAALDALEDMFAGGEVCEGEHPRISRYTAKNGKVRFSITALG